MGEKIGQKVPKRAKIRFPGSGAPACVRASHMRDEGAGPKGPRRRRLGCRPKACKLVFSIYTWYITTYQLNLYYNNLQQASYTGPPPQKKLGMPIVVTK